MQKYFLVNTNDRPVNVTHRGATVALRPGVDNALCLGEMTLEQILPYKPLSQIGVLVRTQFKPPLVTDTQPPAVNDTQPDAQSRKKRGGNGARG